MLVMKKIALKPRSSKWHFTNSVAQSGVLRARSGSTRAEGAEMLEKQVFHAFCSHSERICSCRKGKAQFGRYHLKLTKSSSNADEFGFTHSELLPIGLMNLTTPHYIKVKGSGLYHVLDYLFPALSSNGVLLLSRFRMTEKGVEFTGGGRHDQNLHNRQNRHGCLFVLYFVGLSQGWQGALQNRQNRHNRHEG